MNPVQILMMNQKAGSKAEYGYLYNWYAASDSNFAPSGWHVPTYAETQTLATYLGGLLSAGGSMKETGTTHWDSPNTGADNSSGFTGLGSGYRGIGGLFSSILSYFRQWTTTEGYTSDCGYDRTLDYNSAIYGYGDAQYKYEGRSIRLIKDSTTLSDGETSTMTDYDGNVYDTICIGTQEWTVQNWKCTKLNDGTALTKVTSNTTWAAAGAGDLYYCAYDNDESYV